LLVEELGAEAGKLSPFAKQLQPDGSTLSV
jgi:hypothetical protein